MIRTTTQAMSRDECISLVMNTSIGSDGERSEECDSRPCSMDSANSNHSRTSDDANSCSTNHLHQLQQLTNQKKRRLAAISSDSALNFTCKKLKFSVENILRPDFGAKVMPPRPLPNHPITFPPNERHHRHHNRQLVNNNNRHHDISIASEQQQQQRYPDLTNNKVVMVDNGDHTQRVKSVSSNESQLTSPATSPNVAATAQAGGNGGGGATKGQNPNLVWPAWVYCTRYSDRPSSGPRCRRLKKKNNPEEKRPRTAFTTEQLARLKKEFQENRYLTEKRRQELSSELDLNESQIKIWFQNKRAKIKKQTGTGRNALAYHLFSQGLYNHSTVSVVTNSPSTDEEEDDEDQAEVDVSNEKDCATIGQQPTAMTTTVQ